jgi:serine/threonine-protein kinase
MEIGSYRILSKIGEGSFGRTFLAEHKILGHKVLLKQEKTADPVFMKTFEQEARKLQKVLHFGFPTLLDYFDTPDYGQVMAITYAEGIPGDKLKPVADEHMCWILERVLINLSYLHNSLKIIHCDLKPDNLIINIPRHIVTIIDLGVSLGDVNARTKAIGGTPGYMPPEFDQGLPPVTSSDIYSAGKIAIGITGGDVMSGEPPKDMHPDLKNLIRSMIVRDPRNRPTDCASLKAQIVSLRQKIWGRTTTREEIQYR